MFTSEELMVGFSHNYVKQTLSYTIILGVYILNLQKTWEKIQLAARAIVAIENPADVCVISARPWGQRAVLKFAKVNTTLVQ